jgi:serine/threonine protein phosphatase PrpC
MDPAAMIIHTRRISLPPGTALLLCSDGLWNYADPPKALGRAYTEAAKDADAITACRRLVAFANAAGGRDNITVALLRV